MKRAASQLQGAVALEFLMLFPLVVAMLYAAAVYGMVFFSQYRLQSVVDRAAATALYVDRSTVAADDLKRIVETRTLQVLKNLLQNQGGKLSAASDSASCTVEAVGLEPDLTMLLCEVTYNYEENPIVPAMSFGMLGNFPPVPAILTAEARVAF